jgi:transitional endoplasmic reticulum ATPase
LQRRSSDPRVSQYCRQAAQVTHAAVLHPIEKAALVDAEPLWRRKAARQRLSAAWDEQETRAARDVDILAQRYDEVVVALDSALELLRAVAHVRLHGKITDERGRLTRVRTGLAETRAALSQRDFGAAGAALQLVDRELWAFGGPLIIALNTELQSAAYSRDLLQQLAANQVQRRDARREVETVRRSDGQPEALLCSVAAYELMASGIELVAQALRQQAADVTVSGRAVRVGADNEVAVVQPQDLERFSDVGGLEAVKEQLRRTVGAQLGDREEAVRYGVEQSTVLLYGPPGTGKTLLVRALAGEYGLRYLRVTPAAIASAYAHEATRNLARVFELARQSTPCLLFLDEVDALGSARAGSPSAEHRELVTQLITLLDDYRKVPGVFIAGATNAVDLLDQGLREGRFDVRIPVPMPDTHARRQVIEVHLRARSSAVNWDDLDLDEVAQRLSGRSGAAIAAVIATAAQQAMRGQALIGRTQLLDAIGEREARDRRTLETPVRWEDVVLPPALETRLRELFQVVQHPELAEAVGINAPAGILLYGPPGTGKTTIAKALATEVRSSFYEMSAAELLSKWVGESEERVAKLFATARDNRPSIIFIDEIDALLRRRSASSVAPWEERLVSQFLRELDGINSGSGVFLVGTTNRLDIIDEAVKNRRLVPLEVPLPDLAGRRALLDRLFAKVRRSEDVDLDELARATGGMSGADLKRLRDEVGIKALSRGLRDHGTPSQVEVTVHDFYESLHERKAALIPD